MRPDEFWNSTMYEICVYMETMRNKEECKFKDLHYLASLVRVAVASALDPNGRVQVPSYEEMFERGSGIAEKSNVYHGWEDSKAYMKAIQEVRSGK